VRPAAAARIVDAQRDGPACTRLVGAGDVLDDTFDWAAVGDGEADDLSLSEARLDRKSVTRGRNRLLQADA
jgi:hypothetical protein